MIQNESVKNLFGRVLNHYGTGTSLKKTVGRREHTVMPHNRLNRPRAVYSLSYFYFSRGHSIQEGGLLIEPSFMVWTKGQVAGRLASS